MYDVVQKLNKSIWEFVERFNLEAANAPDLTDDIQIMAYSRLAFELSRKNRMNVKETHSVAHVYMIVQELLSQRRTDVT